MLLRSERELENLEEVHTQTHTERDNMNLHIDRNLSSGLNQQYWSCEMETFPTAPPTLLYFYNVAPLTESDIIYTLGI